MTKYDKYPTHPLNGIDKKILKTARKVLKEAAELKDVDPNQAVPLADAVVMALREAGYIKEDKYPFPYDIALRPEEDGDPKLMDDIVVKKISMFRAEAMGKCNWWVACYMEDGSELRFSVHSKRRIEWRVLDLPEGDFKYEPQP